MGRVRVVWGRFFITLCLLSGLISLSVYSLARADGPATPVTTVRVRPGDTLWGLAERLGPPRRDLRQLTYELERVNKLEGKRLQPGMVLALPASWQ